MEKQEQFSFSGVRVTAQGQSIFVPGLLCQLIVSICRELRVSIFLVYPAFTLQNFEYKLTLVIYFDMKSVKWDAMDLCSFQKE